MSIGRSDELKPETPRTDITTYKELYTELEKWAYENQFDLMQSDVIEELILRTLGVDLTATPTVCCRFKESKRFEESFQFAAIFNKEHMAKLGGIDTFRQYLFACLNALSTNLYPRECSKEFTDDLAESLTENNVMIAIRLNVAAMAETLLPAMKATLLAKPELIAYYQRFAYSAPRVNAAFEVEAARALSDIQFDDKIHRLAADAANQKAGEKLTSLTATAVDRSEAGLYEHLKKTLADGNITVDSKAFNDLLQEQKIANTVDILTAENEKLYALIGTALLLHLRAAQGSPGILSTLSSLLPSLLTQLNLLSAPEDVITLQLDTKHQHSHVNQPVTTLTVPADLSDQVVEFFNRYENDSAHKRDDKIEVENKCLRNKAFRSDLHGMMTLFKDKVFQGHRLPLDAACSEFYLTGQKLANNEEAVKDLYHYSHNARNLINLVFVTLDKLKSPTTAQATLWSYVHSMMRHYNNSVEDITSDTQNITETKTRISTYLEKLSVPLANLQKRFGYEGTYTLPQAIRQSIGQLLKLQYKMTTCPLYQLSTGTALHHQLTETLNSIDDMIHHLTEYQVSKDEIRSTLLDKMAEAAKLMIFITGHFDFIMKDQPTAIQAITLDDEDFFDDSRLCQNMQKMTPIFKEMETVRQQIATLLTNYKNNPAMTPSEETEELSLDTLFVTESNERPGMALSPG